MTSEKIKIEIKDGYEIEVELVQPGLAKRSDSVYFMQDCQTKKWKFVRPDVLEKRRIKMNNDFSNYLSRESKAKAKQGAKTEIDDSETPAVDSMESEKTKEKGSFFEDIHGEEEINKLY